jgi:hypothetical protein
MQSAYLHGIRRGDIIEQIAKHMLKSTDTPALMYDKAIALQQLNPQIEKAIYDFERERVKGLTQMTPPPAVQQQLNRNANPYPNE